MQIFIILCLTLLSIDIDDLSAQLHLDTGMAYMQQGLLEQAEEEFQQTLELSEEYHTAVLGLGMIHAMWQSWNRATDYFRQYMDTCPDDYRGFYELSKLYLETDKPDSAALMSDSAFIRSPTTPAIWLQSGKAWLKLGEMDSAEMWFSKGVQRQGSTCPESLVLLASVYRRTSRGAEAREILLPAVEAGYSPACWELARVYLGWEDYLRAGDAISRYLMLSPEGYYADSALLVLEELGESGKYIP
ncbi:MAG: tetratricopeptide repeat protein [Candidatus Aegiribacteria sp.]|nr:tetratricopeptide repeat protein [Candidatus Aegiribacteria sp.]